MPLRVFLRRRGFHGLDPLEVYYSEAICFIVTPRPYATTPVRACSIQDGHVTELEIQFLP